MSNWLAATFGEGFASAAMWIVLAVIVLIVLLVALRLIKTLRSGTFIAGGRNRAPRLAVVDAAAVDAQRRLVLVRRDNVEHLILIGGPTDIVIEPGIRAEEQEHALSVRQLKSEPAPAAQRAPQPAQGGATNPAPQVPPVRAAERPKMQAGARSTAPAPGAAATASQPRRHTVAVTPPDAVDQQEPEVPLRAPSTKQSPPTPVTAAPAVPAEQRSAEVDALDVVPSKTPVQPEKPLQASLEEEMGRLLEDITIEETRRS